MATFFSHSSSFPLLSLPPSRPIPPNRPRSLRLVAAVAGDPARTSTTSVQGAEVGPSDYNGKRVNGLSVLYDDGYGSASVKDYFAAAKEIIRADGGPPRWFCPVECGQPIADSPVMFFLPGVDGTGMGLIMHHKSLGKVFEVRCLHIPVNDRTPFEDTLKIPKKRKIEAVDVLRLGFEKMLAFPCDSFTVPLPVRFVYRRRRSYSPGDRLGQEGASS